MINLNNLIKLDKYTNTVSSPKLRLMTRSFNSNHTYDTVLGSISHYSNWDMSINANGINEISFDVNKYNNGVKNPIWDDLIDLKIVDVNNYQRFEISVDYTDDTKTTKSVHGVSLEAELSQLFLYEFHINDEHVNTMDNETKSYDEIDWEYDEINSVWNQKYTYLYDENDLEHSLLHRVIKDKAPHWSIGHVDKYISLDDEEDTLAELTAKFKRTYTTDGTSIYDFLTSDVAKESNVIFDFDTINRKINMYCLSNCYIENDNGEIILAQIPRGKDTTILVSKEKLANSISISSNKDSLKNCFRVEGGDDIITDMVRAVNINGSNYIYQFADFQLNDMPEKLVQRINEYNTEIESKKDDFYGENGIFTRYLEKYKDLIYKESGMMIDVDTDDPYKDKEHPAMLQWKDIGKYIDKNNRYDRTEPAIPIGVLKVENYTPESFIGATNSVEAMANTFIDARYTVEIPKNDNKRTYTLSADKKSAIWHGVIVIKKNSDESEVYPQLNDNGEYDNDVYFDITIAQDDANATTMSALPYTVQKVKKKLTSLDMSIIDMKVENMSTEKEIKDYFSHFCLNMLDSFRQGYDACRTVIGTTNQSSISITSGVPKELYDYYTMRYKALNEVYEYRKDEVERLSQELEVLEKEKNDFQTKYDFKNWLINKEGSDELYNIFCSFIREDTYKNDYRISDGYEEDNDKLIEIAKNLYDDAEKEIKKACKLQRTITCSLNNLLIMPEFAPLYDSFNLLNYIRIRTEDEIIKARLIGVNWSGDTLSDISVTFSDQIESIDGNVSDLESILNQASSISSSYSSTVLQAKQGSEAKSTFSEMFNNGLNATNMALKNNESNEVEINNTGIICKRMDDEGQYGDKQFRITGNIMAFTDDKWDSLRMAIGEQTFYNPFTKQNEIKYGIYADALVGKLIVGENMYIGNDEGSVEISGDGIKMKKGSIKWSKDGVNGVQSPSIEQINGLNEYLSQLDGRIQTFSQNTDPSIDWTTTELKNQHAGDIWVNPDNGLTKQWTGTKWAEITDSELKKLAESKAQIFTSEPKPPYYVGDLWVQGKDGDIYNCIKNRISGNFDSTEWELSSKYTNDATALTALEKAEQGIKDAANAVGLANTAQSIANTAQSKANSAYTRAENAETKVKDLDDSVSKYLGLGGTTILEDEYMISPYLGGGYLNITSSDTNSRVIVDPKNLGKTGYIFQVQSNKKVVAGIDFNGNAIYEGEINATSGTIGSLFIKKDSYIKSSTSSLQNTLFKYDNNKKAYYYEKAIIYNNINAICRFYYNEFVDGFEVYICLSESWQDSNAQRKEFNGVWHFDDSIKISSPIYYRIDNNNNIFQFIYAKQYYDTPSEFYNFYFHSKTFVEGYEDENTYISPKYEYTFSTNRFWRENGTDYITFNDGTRQLYVDIIFDDLSIDNSINEDEIIDNALISLLDALKQKTSIDTSIPYFHDCGFTLPNAMDYNSLSGHIVFNSIYSSLIPGKTETFQLGTYLNRWNNLYLKNGINISNISTGSGTTIQINSNGDLVKNTSSEKYKHEISVLSNSNIDASKLYDVPVIQFKYNNDIISKNDYLYDKLIPGFSAEKLSETYPIAVTYNNGEIDGWNPNVIIPPMLKLIQEQHKDIQNLQKEIEELKELITKQNS